VGQLQCFILPIVVASGLNLKLCPFTVIKMAPSK